MLRIVFALGALTAVAVPAFAQDALPATFDDYLYQHRYTCVGPFAKLARPQPLTLGDKQYLIEGARLVVQSRDADDEARLGVLSAIKDNSPETRANLLNFFDWFLREKVEAVIVNGDLALNEEDLDGVLERLGSSGLPVFIMMGNSESAGAFSRAYRTAVKRFPNLISLNVVRHVVADDFELASLPGYFDRRFASPSGCFYKQADIDALVHNVARVAAPLVLVSHGPPRGSGALALDRVATGDNVGDPAVTELARRAEISFGIFGHILEAGGAITDGTFSTRVKEGTLSPTLHINAGTANGLPWVMNDSSVLTGMAAVVRIKGGKAEARFQRNAQR